MLRGAVAKGAFPQLSFYGAGRGDRQFPGKPSAGRHDWTPRITAGNGVGASNLTIHTNLNFMGSKSHGHLGRRPRARSFWLRPVGVVKTGVNVNCCRLSRTPPGNALPTKAL